MKTRYNLFYVLSLLLAVLMLQACKDDSRQVLFSVPYEFNFEIRAGLSTFQQHTFEITNIDTRMDSLLNFYELDAASISEVNGREARFTMITPSGDYSFMREISVLVFDPVTGTRRELFFNDRVPLNTGNELQLIPALTNARELMLEDKFNVLVEMQFRDVPTQFIPTRFRFSVDVK